MRTNRSTSIIIAATLGLAATGGAQPASDATSATRSAETSATQAKAKAKARKPPAIDPQAIAALRRMGEFLRQQQSFSVRMTSETDQVLDAGQKVQISATGDLRVRRPDHLRADVSSDLKERQFFYDGKTFTVNGPRTGYFATVSAPPTISQVADELEVRYGLQLPLVDLFRWGTNEADLDEITRATYVGMSKIGGVETDHYAFRQRGLDWQIWIERGARPLPRKLLLTTTDDPARPEHEIAMTWDLDAKHEDAVFTFVPTSDSQRIALAELAPPRTASAAKPAPTPSAPRTP